MKLKLFRISTVPSSMYFFLKGFLNLLSKKYDVVAVSSPGPELDSIHDREGVRIVAVPMKRQISIMMDMISLFRLIVLFIRERPDLVHSITPKAGLLSMVAARIAHVPVRIHTFTGLVFPTSTGMKRRILIIMDKIICLCATYINPEGQGVAEDLKKFRITRKPLHIIANGNIGGLDPVYYSPAAIDDILLDKVQKKLELGPDMFVFVFVGRLVKDKGINELVAAFNDLQQKYTHIRLLLIGNFEANLDPLSPATNQLIDTHPCILYAGFQEDIRPYLAISQALVFPSYREGFPNVPMQAGAMGLPSVVTDINGCNEIIINGHNGLVIPPKDVLAIYQSMERLVTDTSLYNYLRSNARESIVSRYDQQTLWKLIMEEYDAQLKKAGLM